MLLGLEKPLYLNGKPTNCHHCTNRLAGLRNIYKGQNCSRYYCSEKCLINGERLAAEEQLKRVAQAAGQVHSHYLISAAVLAVLMLGYIFSGGVRAFAQENGHALHHDNFYSTWQRADGKGSCCNARVEKDGEVTGDCRPVKAYQDPDDGIWRALIDGRWLKVPPNVIRDYQTPDGNSHACHDDMNGWMCFVRGLPKS